MDSRKSLIKNSKPGELAYQTSRGLNKMEKILQWATDAIIAILALYIGRVWARYDRKIEKDKELIEKIKKIVPVDSEALQFLRTHDFGNSYRDGQTSPFWELNRLLKQPDSFFMNKNLEAAKLDLVKEITKFQEFVSVEIFTSERRRDYWELPNPHEIIRERHAFLRS